ncbi:MAG: anthranilate/aminodeoxychorismate synthase component II, partial [Candidatus Cloacimonetes bacterium]|nr:anthranilate/aminodeoxychorismate synthase component II [Candidatus Cloacimonadota bacterium]
MARILLIDNFDSFTFNLLHLIKMECNHQVQVLRNDTLSHLNLGLYRAIVISPGPGNPSTAGMTMQLLAGAYGVLPILGVCL